MRVPTAQPHFIFADSVVMRMTSYRTNRETSPELQLPQHRFGLL